MNIAKTPLFKMGLSIGEQCAKSNRKCSRLSNSAKGKQLKINNNVVSCAELIAGTKKPVTACALGTLIPGKGYDRPRPFHLDTEYLSQDASGYFGDVMGQSACTPKDVHLFRFQNATVVGQGTVILSDGSLLLDSAIEFINHGIKPDGILGTFENMELPNRGDKTGDGATLLVKRPWYRNFGHYLVDLMPILPAMSAAGVEVDTIIYGDVSGPLKEIMLRCAHEYFPNAEIIFANDQMPLNVRQLLYVQPVHVPPLFKHPTAIDFTKEASISLFGAVDQPFEGSRLYISRQNIGTRHIINSTELEQFLVSRGFVTFFPELHSFGRQIKAFQNAEVIIGGKGAAFTNVIFCNPRAHALVLSSSRFVDPFFWDLASISGIRYSEIFCKDMSDADPSTADFEVDLAKISHFLSLIE
ncbi:glycosyltransferase family 61 protein [Rhizobium sp. SG570]|uniref:glycosyltransferase family 61 protein n=1 Tax=Rhizobium sp. SG570 TaxID=2587113 RepID=UPI00144797E7|nr:glycosyltransferase family 61 protein [Rhizobium sp. SG570]NKJ38571.1 capsular polysaccharide biosynthesis protein [Rhizobium sp. SG570]